MYNRYLEAGGFVPLDPDPQPHPGQHHPGQTPHRPAQGQPHPGNMHRPEPPRGKNDLAGEVVRGLSQLLDGVKKRFSLEKLDLGDLLLVLIILLLYLEDGDNLELIITLGLLLLLGLDDEEARE